MTERCLCCDLPVESCGKQAEDLERKAAARERETRLGTPGWWSAVFAGVCLRCGDRFPVGAPIRRFAQGYACCGDAP